MENINLYEELGRDSMAVVYKGRRMGTLNYVALKCCDKAKRPEITNHVRLCQDLDHPNIVHFYEWYETRKHLWLVVELCTGGSLESVIIRDGCLPENVVRKFGWDLVKGLEHIHKLGIIFSDLTPAKILLDSSGMVKLGNFCYSRTETDTLEDLFSLCSTYEETGKRKFDIRHQDVKKRFQGSPTYMAPEILQGSETTALSDLWALGCVLYYMYTGKPPFFSTNHDELTGMILHQEPSSPVQTVFPFSLPSEGFQNLLRAVLIKNHAERIKWPDLLRHQFWTQEQNKEDDLEEVEEYDDDEEFVERKNGRSSGVSPVQGFVTTLEKSTSSQTKNISIPDSGIETHTAVRGVVRKTQESAGTLAEPQKEDEEEKTQDKTATQQMAQILQLEESFTSDNPSKFRPKSDIDDNTETISLLSSCEISSGSCSISDSLNCSRSPQRSDLHIVKTTTGTNITSCVKALLRTQSDQTVSSVSVSPKVQQCEAHIQTPHRKAVAWNQSTTSAM
ncbi:serine/threonine-protein kinase ULK4 isoform X5 [Hippocampus zosterae]|uniref:serine/threonine-protein kinase ULK4 isoform X5 n=1 Tax=Hippocampus zosterae TaxID=109293 RepID=UPI00223DF3F3|nr:serine/threonine-protein kinase ULK4 isoform X5 [Hippocampus zosterae]